MKVLLNVIDQITETLEAEPFVNTVTYGDIFDVDLSKQTLFPLSHFIVNNVTYNGPVWTVSISLMCMDIAKDNATHQYTMAEQMTVVGRVLEKLRRGDLHTDKYHLEGNPVLEPFKERGENGLFGWEVTFNVVVPNNVPQR